MRYLLLCCFDEKRWDAIPESQRNGIMRAYGNLMKSLDKGGNHVASGRLQSRSTAITIRSQNGTPTVTDGPFAETKEHLGGYHVIECGNVDEAIAIAQRIPTIPFGGAVEVRPLYD